MKFTAVALASLAAVTAVSATPTPQSQFEVFTRRSDNQLFVRYSDVIAYLKARDQDEASTQGLTQPLAGQSTGKGGDAGAGASGSDSPPSQQPVKGLNDPAPPMTHHRPSHHPHHVFGKKDSDSPTTHHHSHHHHVFGKKDSDSPAGHHHSHHHHGYGQNGPSHEHAAAFKSPWAPGQSGFGASAFKSPWAPGQSDGSKTTKTPATDPQVRELRLYRRRHGHSKMAAVHGHDQSAQPAEESQDSRRR